DRLCPLDAHTCLREAVSPRTDDGSGQSAHTHVATITPRRLVDRSLRTPSGGSLGSSPCADPVQKRVSGEWIGARPRVDIVRPVTEGCATAPSQRLTACAKSHGGRACPTSAIKYVPISGKPEIGRS